MQAMQQVADTARGLVGLLAGWAVGFGLTWGALFLGILLGTEASTEMSDRALLGGMLLAMGLLGVLLVSVALAELRRVPAWLLSFLLGMATAPALTLFASMFFLWSYSSD